MAEDVTLGLGGILGESTNLKPINDRPFTRAAQQELSLGLKAKADEAKLAAEKAKVDREYMNIIKPISTGNTIIDANISKRYNEFMANKDYNSYQKRNELGNFMANQQSHAKGYDDFTNAVKKGDILVSPEDKQNIITRNYEALSKSSDFAKNPESNLYEPISYHPNYDINKMLNTAFTWSGDTPLNTADRKLSSIKGSDYASIAVAPEIVDNEINKLLKDEHFMANYLLKNKEKVNKEMVDSKVDLRQAEFNLIKKEHAPDFRVERNIKDFPKASGGFNFNFGGGGSIGSNGIEMKPDPTNIGLININKIVKEGKEPEVLSATILDKNGTSHNFAKIEGFRRIGQDNYQVIGSIKEGGSTVEQTPKNISGEQLAKSVGMSKDALEKFPISFDYDKEMAAREKGFNIYVKKYPKTANKSGELEPTTMESLYGDPDITKYISYKPTAPTVKTVAPQATTKPQSASKTMTSAEYRKLSPTERAAFKTSGGKVEG